MWYSKNVRRVTAFLVYWLVAFGLLAVFLRGDFFCKGEGGSALLAAKLSLAIAILDSILCVAMERLLFVTRLTSSAFAWFGAIIATLIMGVSVAALPSWIYEGYGVFRFEGTWASVSCAFTEGYGIVFPILMAPALALATFVKAALLMLQNPKG